MLRIVELPMEDRALPELLAGLSRTPKELPAKYFYDEAGSALFERICELPEYYLTRAELQLMQRHAPDIAAFIGPDSELIEFGCGSGRKTRLLIEALRPPVFVPVDISLSALKAACESLAGAFPQMHITALCADYTRPLPWPRFDGIELGRRTVYFPGSTVGNFSRSESRTFLQSVRDLVGRGGGLVIGVDLKKAPHLLHAAYNDAQGVTAAFNLNMLTHVNRTFGADFDVSGYEHVAYYDEGEGRIEMNLRARRAMTVRAGGQRFTFAAGEWMRTEISCKYSIEEFQSLGREAGFEPRHVWLDEGERFAVHGMVAG